MPLPADAAAAGARAATPTAAAGGAACSSPAAGRGAEEPLPPHRRKRVLVTGCSGSIGRPVCAWLARRGHRVVGFDSVAAPSLAGVCEEVIVGDICDKVAVAAAVAGTDVMIHLAAFPDIKDPATGELADFVDTILRPNVEGLYVCAEAALQAGVSRLVLASSVQVITGLTSTADVAARPKPNLPARPWATLTAPRVGPNQPAARGDWVPKHAAHDG